MIFSPYAHERCSAALRLYDMCAPCTERQYLSPTFSTRSTTMMSPHRCAIALLGFAFLMLTGCDSTEPDVTGEPPDVLPPDAFSIDADLFSNQAPGATRASKTGEHTHFTHAALRVGPVSLLIKANLIIPTAVTAGALQADPVAEDGTWVWTATADTLSQDVSFRLEGTPDGDAVTWRMMVTAPDPAQGQPLENFALYTAQTALNGSSGSWSLFYRLDGERTRVLHADFTVTSDTEKGITFSVPEAADQNAGDSVRYAVDGTQRTFEWTQVEDAGDTVTTVMWNAETKSGSIVAPSYNDGERACWNESFQNVACSG
jgi:hypothetical protein